MASHCQNLCFFKLTAWEVCLSAIFYASDGSSHPKAPSADFIFPLSTLRNDDSNMFSVPPRGNTIVKFPRNMISAFLEIQASGNYQEEFWYNNVLNKHLSDLPSDTTYILFALYYCLLLNPCVLQIWKWCFSGGTSVGGWSTGRGGVPLCNSLHWCVPILPLRRAISLIQRIGAWVPTVWRPVVAINAYDLPTYNIDLTPFVPLLTDGNDHTITLDISSDEPDHCGGPVSPLT